MMDWGTRYFADMKMNIRRITRMWFFTTCIQIRCLSYCSCMSRSFFTGKTAQIHRIFTTKTGGCGILSLWILLRHSAAACKETTQ